MPPNKQITKLAIGCSTITVVTPLDVFDTPIQEMVDDHYKVISAIVGMSEEVKSAKMSEIAATIKSMKDRGMFKVNGVE